MWRKVLAWEEEEKPINYFEKMDDNTLIKEFNDFDQMIDVASSFSVRDLHYRAKISDEMKRRNIDPDDPRIWTNKIINNMVSRANQKLSWEELHAMEADPFVKKPEGWQTYTAYLTYPEEGVEEIDIYAENQQVAEEFARRVAQEGYEPGYTSLRVKPRGPGYIFSSKKAAQNITLDSVLRKQIKPGDLIKPPRTLKDNTGQTIFTEGKEYSVLDYFEANQTIGLKVQCETGPWTITFRQPDGIAPEFTWRKPTQEEEQFVTIENNPFITDILNILASPNRYPMTVDQVSEKVQQMYLSEGSYSKLNPKEFQYKITEAWGQVFHLGLAAMVQKSDKVNLTQEGRQFLQG